MSRSCARPGSISGEKQFLAELGLCTRARSVLSFHAHERAVHSLAGGQQGAPLAALVLFKCGLCPERHLVDIEEQVSIVG
jgi:hypothetical protein